MRTYLQSTLAALGISVAISLAGCTFVSEKLGRDDSYAEEIESTVTNGLRSTSAVNAAPISVEFEKERIVLGGVVGSVAESAEAEAVARRLYPEFDVLNKLVVP